MSGGCNRSFCAEPVTQPVTLPSSAKPWARPGELAYKCDCTEKVYVKDLLPLGNVAGLNLVDLPHYSMVDNEAVQLPKPFQSKVDSELGK